LLLGETKVKTCPKLIINVVNDENVPPEVTWAQKLHPLVLSEAFWILRCENYKPYYHHNVALSHQSETLHRSIIRYLCVSIGHDYEDDQAG